MLAMEVRSASVSQRHLGGNAKHLTLCLGLMFLRSFIFHLVPFPRLARDGLRRLLNLESGVTHPLRARVHLVLRWLASGKGIGCCDGYMAAGPGGHM